ncbi:MAG: hypothetical protein EOT05_02085 [Candidatus Microsaccharimonas sossegonensis]|uniref:Uncharacterized protein n=1 Tax=Candidatus Microsaccharimonas sossegonensis TaxID=2506948 RepID=A0A4Q0AHM9_9BACT|nr:hypothetical protein [Microbacterium sp. MRS-1]RWZ78520.1 MAG: hypothetical protein EOT05_02085 [Candidatus Microsaccharimonas sossegonensis]
MQEYNPNGYVPSVEEQESIDRMKAKAADVEWVVDDGSEAIRHLRDKQAGPVGNFDGKGVTKEQLDDFLRAAKKSQEDGESS